MRDFSLGLYEKSMPNELTIREKLQAAKDTGFDFLEISIDETEEKLKRLDMSKAERFELLRAMVEVELPIRTICLSGHRKFPLGSRCPKTRERGMEILKKAIQLADDLGVRIIMLAGYDVYYEESSEETKALFEENLKEACELAAKSSIVLGFETMETEFMNTVEKAMEYVKKINSSYLNVYPDSGNITNAAMTYKTDVLNDLECGAGKLVALHLKESLPGKFREIPYGTGHVKFKEIIQKALELGVRKFVSEFWYTGNPEWKQELKDTCDMMRNFFVEDDLST